MIYITGDTHGEFTRIKNFCKEFNTSKKDYLIILGDAGINYFGEKDNELKKDLQSLPITFLLVYGNHEERPENISSYKEIKMFSGIMYQEEKYPNLLFFKDGEIYDILGKKVLVIGGAFSINKELMIEHGYKWFKDEQPNEFIKKHALKNLTENNYKVDYILTHTCPYKYLPIEMFHVGVDQNTVDKSTEKFLDLIENNTNYTKWYCGHFHTDKVVDKINFMFNGFKTLD